ncbi:MAG: lytic murein transglycosylase [Deltaproteobacteria bacterium]|nr:lytic murein transglycosylase [Deltaproteobacteria bacterium]
MRCRSSAVAGHRIGRILRAIALAMLAALAPIGAGDAHAQREPEPLAANYRGWDYIVEKLVADGVDPRQVRRVFTDPRVEPFTGLQFSLYPRESSALYRGFTQPASVALARRCKASHERALREAEERFGVPATVVASIIHVESGCGRNTGKEVVLFRLARLAMANEPENLRDNITRHTETGYDPAIEERTRERGRYLENTFYPEVLATFQVSDRLDMDPLALRGSGSGAFGMPQFLPRSYLSYGADGNGDGRVSLYDADDAIFSCANYLASHGWRPGISRAEKRRVIWHYNRSDSYIDTVLALADRLDGGAAPAEEAGGKPRQVQRQVKAKGKANARAPSTTSRRTKKSAN